MCLAIPGKIVEFASDGSARATVEVAGVRRKVDLGLLQEDMPVLGDWILIHVGFAMSKISEQDALALLQDAEFSLDLLQQIRAVAGFYEVERFFAPSLLRRS